uniref:Uncharacterized protein n=1 Tax=Romanomermis culicivorax TaxID=13658 RepID=A0A915L3Y7_ROMCU
MIKRPNYMFTFAKLVIEQPFNVLEITSKTRLLFSVLSIVSKEDKRSTIKILLLSMINDFSSNGAATVTSGLLLSSSSLRLLNIGVDSSSSTDLLLLL